MYSVLAWRTPSKAPLMERRQLGPISVQWAWVNRGSHTPAWVLRRRVDKATLALNRHGISQGVFPAEMAPVGIHPVDSIALRQHLAVALLERQLLQPAQSTVALVGGTMTPTFTKTLTQLALRYRHVLLQATGSEAVCQQLRSRYGVAVQCNPGLSQLNGADGIIAFTPLPGLRPHIATYDTAPPLPELTWPPSWSLPKPLTVLDGWSMVAGSGQWQDRWSNVALGNISL